MTIVIKINVVTTVIKRKDIYMQYDKYMTSVLIDNMLKFGDTKSHLEQNKYANKNK